MVKRKNVEDLVKDDEMDDLIEDEDFEAESDSEEDKEGDIKLSEPSKTAIYNRDEIIEKLKDISWPENIEWIHKLSIDIDQEKEVDVNDDLARELAFYTQALDGTRQAFEKLQSMGLPFLRPPDYYAEMVKTDAHMVKVKGRLLSEKKKIEESEERRKARESKKLAKEIQSQKQKTRAKQKKDEIESVKKWRKQRQQSGFAGGKDGADVELPFEDDTDKTFRKAKKQRQGVAPGDRSGGKTSQMMKKGKGFTMSREFKNSKFGFGGRKGLKKQNTAETTDDLKGFNNRSFGGSKKRK
jgi:rRNA-processing protein EBP2